jgi:hypothetical protein
MIPNNWEGVLEPARTFQLEANSNQLGSYDGMQGLLMVVGELQPWRLAAQVLRYVLRKDPHSREGAVLLAKVEARLACLQEQRQ